MLKNKSYRAVLEVDEETEDFLKKSCIAYCNIFNTALDIQFEKMSYGLSYEEQLTSLSSLTEKVFQKIEGIPKYERVEKGLIERASEESHYYFQKWWSLRMGTTTASSAPFYMKSKDHFRTSTILKVSKGGYLYFPKFKRVKIIGNRVPIGDYQNTKVTKSGDEWYAILEDTKEIREECKLAGTLDVFIDPQGNLFFRDKVFPNVIKSEKYEKIEGELKALIKKLKRKINLTGNISKQAKLLIEDIKNLQFKMKEMKRKYFRSIMSSILKEKPEILNFIFDTQINERQSFSSQFFKDSETLNLMKMISRRMQVAGTEIRCSDSIKEEVNELLNS